MSKKTKSLETAADITPADYNPRRISKGWKTQRTLRKYAAAMPEISKQELAQISHRYDSQES